VECGNDFASALKHLNPKVRILPIMVTRADFSSLQDMAGALAGVFYDYMHENGLAPGKDIAFVISNDATHYGPDFDYQPFGTDARAHRKAVAAGGSTGSCCGRATATRPEPCRPTGSAWAPPPRFRSSTGWATCRSLT